MSLIPREPSGRLRWIAWAAFWAGFAYLGQMQAWVFGDHSDKPWLADVVDPIHFWFPTVLLMAPCYWLAQSLSALLRFAPLWMAPVGYVAVAVAWVLAFSRMIVWAGDRLHPDYAGGLTAWTIGGFGVVVVGMRLLALLAPIEASIPPVDAGSFVLLTGVVVAAWLYVVAGIVVAAARRRGGGRRVNDVTTPPTSFPPV